MGCCSSELVVKNMGVVEIDGQPSHLVEAIVKITKDPTTCYTMQTYKIEGDWHTEWKQDFTFGPVSIEVGVPTFEGPYSEHVRIHFESKSKEVSTALRTHIELQLSELLGTESPAWTQDTFVDPSFLCFTRVPVPKK